MSEPVPFRLVTHRPRFVAERFNEIRPSTSNYLTKGLYPRRGLAYIAGQSKAGKTFIVLDHTLKIACGATVMGRRTKHMGVVYVAAEDAAGCRTRIEAWRKRNPRESYTPFVLLDGGVDLADSAAVDDLREAIREAVAEFDENGFDLGVVVFDTLAQCLPGAEENSSADMGLGIQAIQGISRDFDCLAMVVAHHGKDDSRGLRGWSGQIGAADAILSVKRDEEMPDHRTITLDKIKNGRDGDVIAFSLVPAPIGLIDEDGEEVWSCTVTYEGAADTQTPVKRNKALNDHESVTLEAVRWVIDNGTTQEAPPSALGVRAGTRCVRRKDVSERAEVIGLRIEGEKDDTYRQRLHRSLLGLKTKRRTRMEGDLIWLI